MPDQLGRLRLSRSQRGALGLMGVMTLLLAILFAALAIDTGRLMMQQRHLQTVADMAALDASARSGYCGPSDAGAVTARAHASAERNRHPVSGANTLSVALGRVHSDGTGVRQFTATSADASSAVQVVAGRSMTASLFAGGILGHQVELYATAVAERRGRAGFSAGSITASVSSEQSSLLNALLGGVLGSSLSLDAVAYEGLVATDLSLGELVDASAGIGSVSDLLDADLSLSQLVQIYADAVSASDAADVRAIAAMQTLLAANVASLPVIAFGDILSVTAPDVDQAASADVNLLDLLTTTALVANGDNAITLPLAVSLPGDTLNLVTELTVVEPPQLAIGLPGKNEQGDWHTEIKTAQIDLLTRVETNVNLLVGVASVSMALRVQVAQGTAWLETIECRTMGSPESRVTIGVQPGIAAVALTDPDDPAAAPDAIAVSLLGIPVANVPVSLDLPLENPGASELEYTVGPENPLPQLQTASSSLGDSLANGLGGLDSELQLGPVEVLSLSLAETLLLGPLLDVLLGDLVGTLMAELLSPLLSQLSAAIIDPLLDLLGIQLGAMDVKLVSLNIGSPELKR